MRILAIETSCDETAIAIVEANPIEQRDERGTSFTVLGNALLSQVEAHRQYGGVFPNLAKREHAKNLVPILEAALEEAELLHEDTQALSPETHDAITKLLEREPGLDLATLEFLGGTEPPSIDIIAVTAGPGLEPALWVGINFAKALALAWEKPLVAVNHMEGHILAGLASERSNLTSDSKGLTLEIKDVAMPVLALLISGGHTELVLMRSWLEYEMIGQTRDDAVGEAFDKVARMLGLPYPGGPEISKLAESIRSDLTSDSEGLTLEFKLPRPMIHDNTCDFSFAGLKTAVRTLLQPPIHKNSRPSKLVVDDEMRRVIAREFEDAVAEVLWKKTERALEATGAQTLVIGGGVSANTHIRRVFGEKVNNTVCCSGVKLRIPQAALTTDNALMIAMAGYYHALKNDFADSDALRAEGNLRLET